MRSQLERLTRWLWDAGMGEIVRQTTSSPVEHLVLIPTWHLGLLPWHAARNKGTAKRPVAVAAMADRV
jgi:hypothetical protein